MIIIVVVVAAAAASGRGPRSLQPRSERCVHSKCCVTPAMTLTCIRRLHFHYYYTYVCICDSVLERRLNGRFLNGTPCFVSVAPGGNEAGDCCEDGNIGHAAEMTMTCNLKSYRERGPDTFLYEGSSTEYRVAYMLRT